MKSYSYRVIIEPDGDSFHAYVPALVGCHTFGASLAETKANIREAISVYIASLVDDQESVPEDVGFESIETVSIGPALNYA